MACYYQSDLNDTTCRCSCPKLRTPGRVPLRICGRCPYFRTDAPPDVTCPPFPDDSQWAVAVTTAPRENSTLTSCLDSLSAAGWNRPVVFAEPGSESTDATTVWNHSRKGAWHNWRWSAEWCLKYTDSQRILTVQDDSLFHPHSRLFLESRPWPTDAAFISLYTPLHYTKKPDGQLRPTGINRIETRSLWGACALVWNRRTLSQVINHPLAKTWKGARAHPATMRRRAANPELVANIDTAIGNIVNAMKLDMLFIDPSPVRHVASHSTLGHGGNAGQRNCYRCADSTLNLADQVGLQVSTFGTLLKERLEQEAGEPITCGACAAEVLRLNELSAEQIRSDVAQLAERIRKRAGKMAPRLWQRAGSRLAPSAARRKLVGLILDVIPPAELNHTSAGDSRQP